MNKENDNSSDGIEIKKLYPRLSTEEIRLAEEALEEYLQLTLRIFNRISNDIDEYTKFRAEFERIRDQENQSGTA